MYVQIVGKVRATLSPTEPDWGHAPLSLTARGVNTSPIPHPNGVFDIDLDFIDHVVSVRLTDGRVETILLEPRRVADFYAELMDILDRVGLAVEISATPATSATGSRSPRTPCTRATSRSGRTASGMPFSRSRACSSTPGGLRRKDLAGPALVGVSSTSPTAATPAASPTPSIPRGFWPGDERFPQAAFYAYTSPRPSRIESAAVEPDAGYWSDEMGEFLLPYDAIRAAADPPAALLAFLESTYRAGASLGGLGRGARAWHLSARVTLLRGTGRHADRGAGQRRRLRLQRRARALAAQRRPEDPRSDERVFAERTLPSPCCC